MNRRKFITTTALALPSVTLLGAISTQTKTYRSATSLFSNEDMTEWCNKNGLYYAKDDELNKQFFKYHSVDILMCNDSNSFSRDESLIKLLRMRIDGGNKLFKTKYVVKDIYASNNEKYLCLLCCFSVSFFTNICCFLLSSRLEATADQ